MKKLIWFLMFLLFLLPAQQTFAKEYFVVASGFIGGTAGKLDAIECEDIKGVNPPSSATAITTGSIALVVDSNKEVAVYRYNASGTDSEDSVDYTIVVPDDRATDCSGNGQWEKIQDTTEKGIYIEDPTTESLNNIFWFMEDITITYVWCKTDTGTASINIEDGSDNNILTAELVCDAGGQTSCSSGCDVNTINGSYDNITSKTEDVDLDISATASSPTELTVYIGYTIDD